ncbi:hypothetical protein GGD64_008072 [Bradyrhizobium sp. CIR3A]|nr:hypothetical protein [Bradyrhizobium sp. CIR3A]MBB4399204.1 hypothetical protein [Bradyrhizobium sp. ERR14]
MLNRSAPEAPPALALNATEIGVLDRLVNDKPKAKQKTLSHYLIKIARLGGYLARVRIRSISSSQSPASVRRISAVT